MEDVSPEPGASPAACAQRSRRQGGILAWLGRIFALAAFAPPLAAQATAPVPLGDPAYALVDRVLARLPLAAAFHGQRPYTRETFARLARDARARWRDDAGSPPAAEDDRGALGRLLAALEERFRPELAALAGGGGSTPGPRLATDRVALEATVADSPGRGIRPTPPGSADGALVNPLLGSRFGRESVDGVTLALESEHRLRLHERLVLFGGPRAALHAPRGGGDDPDLLLRTGAVRGTLGGWALQLGRAELRRGQGRHAGALRSDQPPPLDMVLFESERPFRLPWILDGLGPATFSAFLADLGADQNFPRATLYGSWLSVRPSRALELGGGYLVQSGGEGSPEQGFWERVSDHLLFVGRLFRSPDDFQASNKVAGLEARLTLPGVVAWGEWYLDDFRGRTWRRLGETLWLDAARVFGLSLPRMGPGGALTGWLEYRHTGIRMYRHGQFTSGLTQEGYILGDPLGPDARAVAGGVDLWSEPVGTLALEATWESRSQDVWTSEGDLERFVKAEDGPEEERWRVQLRWDRHRPGRRPGWRVEAGVERAETFDFVEGRNEWNALLAARVDFDPR